MKIIGLMSGTSADGIDVALVNITGQPPALAVQLVQHLTIAYDSALAKDIFDGFRPESSAVDQLCRLNVRLGEAYADAILFLLREIEERPDQIDLIASHGQTVWYDAPTNGQLGSVLALGEPAIIAERTGITTISNFRSRDLAAGGFGAPLVSYMDWLLFRHPTQTRAIQNIGGIGNVTFLPPLNQTADPVTFDTGPGNMIMDYCACRATGDVWRYDTDGQLAAQGKINAALLADLMHHPYLAQLPPKTTGRETFGVQYSEQVWIQAQGLGLTPNDILATITAFTAESIADAYRRFLPEPVTELFIAGGGAQNPTLLAMLHDRLPDVMIRPHDQLGIPADAKECVLFALLGYETWHGRPGTLPMLTGASHPVILGNITPGRRMPGRIN